jgi:arsenite methyltransferase
MAENHQDRVRQQVRTAYADIARGEASTCCASQPVQIGAERLGYASAQLQSLPEGANLGLGCGNPQAIARLQPGEHVVDLGCGAGVDCFLAAQAVGEQGRVIGVDMTAEMLDRARANARQNAAHNLSFRLGEIEALPLADNSVDVVISNCVINLSTDKAQVFREAIRVLRPGGRLAISDVVAIAEMPEALRQNASLYDCCIAGAASVQAIERHLQAAGFTDIRIRPLDDSSAFIRDWAPGHRVEDYIRSANIEAQKPGDHSPMHSTPTNPPELHPSIVALAALSANIAANHPKQGLCQLEKLRDMGVPEAQIQTVIDIARHIRDEAASTLDDSFDQKAGVALIAQAAPEPPQPEPRTPAPLDIPISTGACCTPTKSGQSCC